MGIFSKKYDSRTQVEWTMEQLLKGEKLTQLDMLMDFGIGHHCEIIRRCRVLCDKEGLGYDYIKTEFVEMKSRRTGRLIRFARYFIPEIVEKNGK